MTVWDPLEGLSSTEWLRRQLSAHDGAQSWLLAGPHGAGKRRASLAMAATVNCTEAPGIGCGECSACARVLRRSYPDLHYIVPEGPLIPVDLIRDLVIPEASRSPFEGRMKVFVFEEAERMNEAAQNALLKTLEEPHPDTMFILLSDQEEELLETIRSRCTLVHLDPLPEQSVVDALVAEGVDPTLAKTAARISEGDPDRARAVTLDPSVSERRGAWAEIPHRLVTDLDALDVAAEVIDEARAAVKARERMQKEEVKALADALGEGRGTATARGALVKRHKRELRRVEEEVLGEALDFLASFYRDVVAVRSEAGAEVLNLDLTPELQRWAASEADNMGLLQGASRCISARETLTRNANVPLAIEAALLEVVRRIRPPAGERIKVPTE